MKRKIRKINYPLTNKLVDLVFQFEEGIKLIDLNWDFYAVNQIRGSCYYFSKIITIPSWAWNKEEGMVIYYLAHEMAHAFLKKRNNHDLLFMKKFKEICPEKYQHFELTYKPRNAKRAGISEKEK